MDAKPGPRLTLSTMLLAAWASAALLGTVAGAGEGPRAWPAPLALAVLSASIVLPGVAIGVWRRASAVARKRGLGRGGAWGLIEAAWWNALGALIAFVPIAFALNYRGWVRAR